MRTRGAPRFVPLGAALERPEWSFCTIRHEVFDALSPDHRRLAASPATWCPKAR